MLRMTTDLCVTLSPRWGEAKPDWTVILPRPLGGETGPVLFRGRVRGNPISRLNYSGSDPARDWTAGLPEGLC